jgi:glycine cleavage system H protein
MTKYLEYSLDKFIFKVATDRVYHTAGVWAKEYDGLIRLGLSDFLQQRSGDVAFVTVIEAGSNLSVGDDFADIETIKVDISLPKPVDGTLDSVNQSLELEPEIINEDPYGNGWLAAINATDWPRDRAKLMDPQAFFEQMKSEAEKEV